MIDFTKHRMEAVIDYDWSPCHISERAVTYNNIVFESNSDRNLKEKGTNAYFWFEKHHVKDENRTIRSARKYQFERVQVSAINGTTGLFGMGLELNADIYKKGKSGNYFILMPAPSAKRTPLISHE